MQETRCPRCSAPIVVRASAADDRGRVRARCPGCGAGVLVTMNERQLRLSPELAIAPAGAADDVPLAEQVTVWALIVHELRAASIGHFRHAVADLPRFRSNPNKVHDLLAELPFVVAGLPRADAAALATVLGGLGATYEVGAHEYLLDEYQIPVPLDLRDERLAGLSPLGASADEPDDDGDGDGAFEIDFDVRKRSDEGEGWLNDEPVDGVLLGEEDGGSLPLEELRSELDALEAAAHAALGDGEDGLVFGEDEEPDGDERPRSASATAMPSPGGAAANRAHVPVGRGPALDQGPRGTVDAVGLRPLEPLPDSESGGSGVVTEEMPVDAPAARHTVTWAGTATTGTLPTAEGPSEGSAAPRPPVRLIDEFPDTEESVDDDDAPSAEAAFPITTIDRIAGRGRILGGVHATVVRASATFDDKGVETADSAMEDGLARLRDRAEGLGATGIVGLRVATSALPSRVGWIQLFVLTGTAVR